MTMFSVGTATGDTHYLPVSDHQSENFLTLRSPTTNLDPYRIKMEQALDYNLIIGIAFGIFGLVLIVLWIALPFAVFRIKQGLDETNRHLKAIVEQLKAQTDARAIPSLDETNNHLRVIVELLRRQTQATLISKKPVKPSAGGSVTRLFRGKTDNDEDDQP